MDRKHLRQLSPVGPLKVHDSGGIRAKRGAVTPVQTLGRRALVNRWTISDEVRYGLFEINKRIDAFAHSDEPRSMPLP
jgi:hypothetical protein